jgi:hypothetical protein
VDRPNEVDIRIFPKYDDAEVIKVGNPALSPQYTNTLEFGYKTSFSKGSVYGAAYHRITNGTITRIITRVPPSPLIYAVFQNAGRSTNTGLELVWQHKWADWFTMNANLNGYYNVIDSFTVENKYPVPTVFSAPRQSLASGNVKFNGLFQLPGKAELQLTLIYLAPDLIPQGRIGSRFSVDAGLRKSIQKGRGEWFVNATDMFNTLRIKKSLTGNGFRLESIDYYETQVFRIGYAYKFP